MVAGRQSGHTRSHRLDDSGTLMSKDRRQGYWVELVPADQVCMTDSHPDNTHQDFVISVLGDIELFQLEGATLFTHHSRFNLHALSPPGQPFAVLQLASGLVQIAVADFEPLLVQAQEQSRLFKHRQVVPQQVLQLLIALRDHDTHGFNRQWRRDELQIGIAILLLSPTIRWDP